MINDTDTESNIAEQERRNIEDLGSVETKNPRGNIHCLNIIGQVEGAYGIAAAEQDNEIRTRSAAAYSD